MYDPPCVLMAVHNPCKLTGWHDTQKAHTAHPLHSLYRCITLITPTTDPRPTCNSMHDAGTHKTVHEPVATLHES